MTLAAELAPDRRETIFPPLALSLLLHGLIALVVLSVLRAAPPETASSFDVQVLQPEEAARWRKQPSAADAAKTAAAKQPLPVPKKQIVAPSDAPEQKPDQTNLFSDRDSRTVEETIKHGEPAPPAKPPPARAAERRAADATHPETRAKGDARGADRGATTDSVAKSSQTSIDTKPLVGLSDLFVRPSDLARDPSLLKGESGDEAKTVDGGKRDLAMLDRPDLWADPGPRGSTDYLPNVREGNVTMLNAKADKFAPFVRRVGLRVFQGFSMEFKRMVTSGATMDGTDSVQVEAVMSRDGKRVDVVLRQHDGPLGTDRVLLANLDERMFFDENPPADAVAADGRIHFVFALNAAVESGRGGRHGGGPGAQWVMGAGLL
jgi:hypothetical protein